MSRYLVMPSPAQLGTQHVTSGLVGYWDAGNSASYAGSGTTWTNISGVGTNGTLFNSTPFTKDRGGGFTFNGTNRYGECAHTSEYNSASITCIAWVLSSSTNSNTYRPILCKHTMPASTSNRDYQIYTHRKPGSSGLPDALHFSSRESSGSWTVDLPSGAPAAGEWGCYGFWVDGDTLQTGAIVNGQKLSTAATLSAGLPQLTAPLWIGRGDYHYSNATISVIQLYNRALSASEITQNFNAFRGRFGL